MLTRSTPTGTHTPYLQPPPPTHQRRQRHYQHSRRPPTQHPLHPPPNSAKGWCLPVPTHNTHPPVPTPCILDQAAPHVPTHRAHRTHGGPTSWRTPPLETHVRRTSPLQNCGGKDGAASSLMGSVEGRQLRRQLSRTHGPSQCTMVHLADSKKDAKQKGTWYSTIMVTSATARRRNVEECQRPASCLRMGNIQSIHADDTSCAPNSPHRHKPLHLAALCLAYCRVEGQLVATSGEKKQRANARGQRGLGRRSAA